MARLMTTHCVPQTVGFSLAELKAIADESETAEEAYAAVTAVKASLGQPTYAPVQIHDSEDVIRMDFRFGKFAMPEFHRRDKVYMGRSGVKLTLICGTVIG